MKLTKVLSIILALVISVSAVFVFASCDNKDNGYTANNTEYVIGLSGPLTGGAAMYGQAVQYSAQMAIDEINEAGGLNGVKFKLIATDDMHDATKISTNYSSMLEGGMQISLGTVTTAPGLEFKNLSYEDNVFFLTPSASGDKVPEYANGYQMCFADSNQGSVAAKYVNENYKGQKIGILYKSDDAYSTGIYDKFVASLDSSFDGNIVTTNFVGEKVTSFDAQIEKLMDCKFIFMPIYYDNASIFMGQAIGSIPATTVYYGCDGFDGIDNIEGFDITKVPQKIIMLSHFNSKATEGKAAEYIRKYTAKYPNAPLNQFGASAYDCVYAIYGAMKAAIESGKEIPVTISASDLCEILKEQFNGGYTYKNGATGAEIKWESTGYVNKEAVQYVIKEAN